MGAVARLLDGRYCRFFVVLLVDLFDGCWVLLAAERFLSPVSIEYRHLFSEVNY